MEESPKKMRLSQRTTDQNIPAEFSYKPNECSSTSTEISSSEPSLQTLLSAHTHLHDHQEPYSTGRERLKRHREEVAGRVSVPDRWGKEDLLKDWIDYSSFDKLLVPNGIRSARQALVVDAERRRQAPATTISDNSSPRGIESRCF